MKDPWGDEIPSGAAPKVAPPWAETTCKVLASTPRYSHYLAGTSLKKPSTVRLAKALCSMSYKHVELQKNRGLDRAGYEAEIRVLVRTWGKTEHENLIDWLDGGGHTAALSREEATRAELVSREMEADEDSHVALAPELRAPEQTLEEVLEDFDRNSIPGSGEW